MARAETRPLVAGVGISHPDRVVFPAARATKLDLARYYETIAPWVLPHLADRPLPQRRHRRRRETRTGLLLHEAREGLGVVRLHPPRAHPGEDQGRRVRRRRFAR